MQEVKEMNPKQKRDWLIGQLVEQTGLITFTKKDGTPRTMRCTLQSDVAIRDEKKTDRVKVVNEEVLPVFDLDKNEWRSFRMDSITNIEFTMDKK